jgi:hypothetical protein
VRNGTYTITANGSTAVVITLPRNEDLQVGDRVTVTGQGTAPWRLAQNAQQYVVTTNVPGNVVPGSPGSWVPRDPDPAAPAQNWISNAQSASGNRIAAASTSGIFVSADGGATWSRSNAPAGPWAKVTMNSDGSRMAAAMGGGAIYVSSDFGATWTATAAGTRPWSSVYISENGQRIVGTTIDAGMFVSNNGGTSFTLVAGTANVDWRAVTGSADGMRLLATSSRFGAVPASAGIYVSTDGGVTWTRRPTTGPDAPFNNWVFAACSSTCMRMAVLDNGGFPYVSDDGGTTFHQRFGFSNWSGVAVSGDGTRVVALEPRNDTYGHTGYVFLGNGADDWPFLGENRWYWGVSLSNDGHWVVVGDRGPEGAGGRLYTSQGNRTSGGTLGFIGGGQNQGVEVTYQGNGRFTVTTVTNAAGGPFTIR